MSENVFDKAKISDEEWSRLQIGRLSSRPNAKTAYGSGGYDANAMKAAFDAQGNMLKEHHNSLVDSLSEIGRAEAERQQAEDERKESYKEAESERDRLYGKAEDARDEAFAAKEAERAAKFDKFDLVQTPGNSTTKAMSQKAVTDYVPKVKTRNLMTLVFENAKISSADGSFEPITPDRSFYGTSFAASPDYIEVEAGETYTLSWKLNSLAPRIYVHMYNATHEWLGESNKSTANITSWTPQLDDTCRYIRIYLYKESAKLKDMLLENFQMEKGNIATPYIIPERIRSDVLDIEYAQELGYSDDNAISQKVFTEKITDTNAAVEGVLDSFNSVKTIAYATGQASRDDATLVLSTAMSVYIGWAVPIKKANLPTKATGVTVWLLSNENKLNVAVDLLDQNTNLIKSLAEEEISLPSYLYYSGENSGYYLKEHTFNCDFDRAEVNTDVAYIRVYIPNTTSESTARLRLGLQKTAQATDEIDVTVTPTYYTRVGENAFSRDTMVDLTTGETVARPQNIFVRIQRDSTKPHFAYDAYGLPILELDGYTANMNKDNAVTLAYKYGDRKGSCTLKWQGSSSIAYPKKNYTIKFDSKFEAKEGWGEQKKYCLKANYIDFSHSRNICCAKLWGGVVKSRSGVDEKLTALVNGGAIDGFPICVVINGEYKGLYTFNIPKDGWMFGMGDGTSEAILCAENASDGRSTFHKEALLDETDWSIEYQSDGFTNDAIRTSFNRLVRACINSDGTDLDTTIAQYLDWESAIDYYAHCLVTLHHDGISKNCLMVTYDGIKWFFSAYDMDSTFGLHWNGSKMLKVNYACSVNYLAKNHRVFELIKTYKADELKARYNELVNGALSEETVIETFTNFAGQIPKALLDEEVKIWTTLPSTSVNNVSQIIDFNRRRRAYIDPQIEKL